MLIKDGIVGHYPLEKGRARDFCPFVFIVLCTAFEIFIKTNQINGQDRYNPHSSLAKIVDAVMNKENFVSNQLVNSVLKDTDINLMATNCDTV